MVLCTSGFKQCADASSKHMKHSSFPLATSLLVLCMGLFLWLSCTKPTPFGSELLDDQFALYNYTDTLTLRCTLVREDSILSSDRSSTASYMFCGQINDPVFGRSQSDIYTLFRMNSLNPNFKNATVDSIVMYLNYDGLGIYGDTLQAQTLRVHRLDASALIQWDKDYYSNQSFPVGQQIGEVTNFLPTPNISTTLFDTTNKAPYVRIPLDNAFGQEILNLDSLDRTADTTFWRKLRGIRITAEPAGSPGAMLAFDLNNTTFSRVRMYYKLATDTSSQSRTYDFSFVGGNKLTNFTHDYSSVPVGSQINQEPGDYLFLQGMSGLRMKVEIPYAHLMGKIAVNKAELELSIADYPGDNPLLTPARQIVLTEILGDTTVSLTSDVLYSLGSTGTGGFDRFGGFPEMETDNGMSINRYRLTLTRRFQAMADNSSGDIKNQTVYLNVYPQSRSAMRSIIFSPKSSTFPAKLALKFTKVQ